MTKSIHAELITFSKTLKPWQRDALRRHTTTSVLSSTDIAMLTDIAYEANLKGESALNERSGQKTTFDNPVIVPFAEAHVPSSSAAAPPITLSKVRHIQGVNRLRPGADLTLNPIGLNIVFGLNGVGKSGYTRILKSCCHAKAKDPIKGDVYQSTKVESRAKIWYGVGEEELDHEWTPQVASNNSHLSRVAVYDSQTAAVHVGKNPTELSFTPSGLELIAGLVGTYAAVSEETKRRIAVLNGQQVPTIFVDAVTTVVREALDKLGRTGGVEAVNLLGALTVQEKHELVTLPGEIANLKNSSKTSRERHARLESTNYRKQGSRIRALSERINHEQVRVLKAIWARLREIDIEQSVEFPNNFASEPLPGVLSPKWKAMWNAVKDYANDEGGIGSEFPSDDSVYCPLCNQTLSPEAHERFSRFKDAMTTDLSAEKQRLTEQVTSIIAGIRTAVSEDNINADMLTLVETDHPDKISSFRGNLVLVRDLIGTSPTGIPEPETTLENLTAPFVADEVSPGDTTDKTSVVAQMVEVAAVCEAIADAFEKTTQSIEAESEDGSEVSDKEARQQLLDERSKVFASVAALQDHHNRLVYTRALEKVLAETATRVLSEKSRSLTSSYVARIASDFYANLRKIENLSENTPANEARLRVKMVPSVRKGITNIAFTIDGATDATEKANGVLSEGELRAVSVAAFLADVTSSDDGSAIIFDDPMNSLDHDFQTRIAIRLAEEAHHRQVIVFTHNMSFVGALWHEGVQKDVRRQVQAKVTNPSKVEATYIEITRHPEMGAGIQVAGTGTPTQGFKNLLTKLDREVVPDARRHHKGPEEDLRAYADDCVKFATNLRNAWELAVEEIMIGGVVARNQPAVRTGMLSNLVVVTNEDVAAVDDGMDLNSYYVHSTAAGNQTSLPTPTDMADRIQTARDWLKSFNKRRASQNT